MNSNQKTQIVLASNNQGKIREFQALLPNYEILPQINFVQTEAEETGLTFVENALIKARHAARHCSLPVIADDSGLAVDALSGAPGIYSARYAGVGASDSENNAKLLLELVSVPFEERNACFISVIVLLKHAADPVPLIAHGLWKGKILTKPQGANGFGYDPLFWVPEYACSSAELTPEAKNLLSHRGKALRDLSMMLTKSEYRHMII